MKVKDEFFDRGSFHIGNGEKTRFWEDTWLGDEPLARQYPSLYNIVRIKEATVASVLSMALPVNLTFRRSFMGNKWNRWTHLLLRLIEVQLSNENDVFSWDLTPSGRFTIKSLYLNFMSG